MHACVSLASPDLCAAWHIFAITIVCPNLNQNSKVTCEGAAEAGDVAEAAARLARADLATSLVTEMTELAGTMGRHYALQTGTAPDVAEVRCCPLQKLCTLTILPTLSHFVTRSQVRDVTLYVFQ